MDANIELRIDRLILDGVPAYLRHEIVAAVERTLTQLLAERGLPGAETSTTLTLEPSLIEVSSGARPEAIATQVAQSLYSQVTTGQNHSRLDGRNDL